MQSCKISMEYFRNIPSILRCYLGYFFFRHINIIYINIIVYTNYVYTSERVSPTFKTFECSNYLSERCKLLVNVTHGIVKLKLLKSDGAYIALMIHVCPEVHKIRETHTDSTLVCEVGWCKLGQNAIISAWRVAAAVLQCVA